MHIHPKFKALLAGIVTGAVLITLPSFMILRGIRMLSTQEFLLWAVQLAGCVIVSIYISGKRQQIPAAVFGYGFLLLYNALSILCAALNYGVITWAAVNNVGLILVGCGCVAIALIPKISKKHARAIHLLSITAVLTGVAFVYCTWVPLLAVPGALILVEMA